MSGLYVRCFVRDSDDTAIDTVNLTESSGISGTYTGNYTFATEGVYNLIYIPYTDSGYTTESERAPRATEIINIRLVADKYGGSSRGNGAGGLFEEDIQKIIDAIKTNKTSSIWEEILPSGRKAKDELVAKSEFDYKKDIVKIPEIVINFNEIKDYISLEISSINTAILFINNSLKELKSKNKDINLQPLFNKLNNIISSLKSETINLKQLKGIDKAIKAYTRKLDDNKDLLFNMDKIQLDRMNSLASIIDKKISNMLVAQNSINIRSLNEIKSLREDINESKI